MCKKKVNHGIAVIGIVMLAFLLIGCWSVPPYAGPDAELEYDEVDARKENVLGANPNSYRAGAAFRLKNSKFSSSSIYSIYAGEIIGFFSNEPLYIEFDQEMVNSRFPLYAERVRRSPNSSVFYISVHPKDPANPEKDKFWRLDRIENFISLEEAQAIIAREEAAVAERAAERAAREAANRYDPANFIIVPSNFAPANYTSVDLFTAVSNVEQMPRGSGSIFDGVLATREYVSEVVFVSQNGTDIRFRTADNAISQSMKIDSRSGLTSGQSVRLYYRVSKNPLTEWRVIAIERL